MGMSWPKKIIPTEKIVLYRHNTLYGQKYVNDRQLSFK